MFWRVTLVVGLLAVGLLWPLRASAQSSSPELFRLSWSATDECPSDADVRQELQRLLGASAASPGGRVDASARVSAVKGGFELEIALGQDDQLRARRLTAPHCQELGHAAALIVALAVDPSLTIPGGEKLSEVVPAPCPASAATVTATAPGPAPQCPVCTACAASLRQLPDWHTAALLAASISYGELPQGLPRASAGAAYRADPHWLELSLSGAFASTGFRGDGRGATLWQWYATPRYCVQARFGTTRVGPCASTEVGLTRRLWRRAAENAANLVGRARLGAAGGLAARVGGGAAGRRGPVGRCDTDALQARLRAAFSPPFADPGTAAGPGRRAVLRPGTNS